MYEQRGIFPNHFSLRKKEYGYKKRKTGQNRSRLLFYRLIRLWLRNSGLRPSNSLATAGEFRLIESRNRSRCFVRPSFF